MLLPVVFLFNTSCTIPGAGEAIEKKVAVFTEKIKPRKTLFVTMITTCGIADNDYTGQLVQQQLDMHALFKSICSRKGLL